MVQTLRIILPFLVTIGGHAVVVAFSSIKSINKNNRPHSLLIQQQQQHPALHLHTTSSSHHDHDNDHYYHDRRTFLAQKIITPTIATVAATTSIVLPFQPPAAHASSPSASAEGVQQLQVQLLMDRNVPDVSPFIKGSAEEAKKRFQLAMLDIDSLLDNYDVITKSGGDNVRLYLGTQGVKSNMFGVMKVLKSLKEEADDIVEYSEAMDEFEAYLFQAEGAAYQSMFIEHSSAKGTPESMLKTARADVTSMRKFMSVLAKQLNVEELKVDSLPMVVAGGGGVEVRGRSRGT